MLSLVGWVFAANLYAADLSPGYSEAMQQAIQHASDPSGWTPSTLVVIPDTTAGTTGGLVYDIGKLIVRTATKSLYFQSNYVAQSDYTIYGSASGDATWVTTGNDATRFLLENGVTGDNVTTLLERGLGMNATDTHDAIVEYAVDTEYLMRPTRNPDITNYLPEQYGTNAPFVQPAGMRDEAFNNFTSYYDSWMAGAYGSYAFPWTQLGYTFFWGNGETLDEINGMSEFIILGQSPVEIYGIYATSSYIYTRNAGGVFSSADDAAYGNGFASFKIDGRCDTVWAGHRFQKNVSDAPPNRILISEGGEVSGGQGILVWSLNYDVVNNGHISGGTTDKFGIAETENIAVLFKGDTGTDYGTPITTAGAVNRLINTGTIQSPGTAIRAEAGDTRIINSGVIAGDRYAIRTGSGSDSVTVDGGEITGVIDLGADADTLIVSGAADAMFNVTLNRDTADAALVLNTETVAIADDTVFAVEVTGEKNIRSQERFLIVDTAALSANSTRLVIRNDGSLPMISFSAAQSGNRLSLVAGRDSSYYTRLSGNASLGSALDRIADMSSGDMAEVLGVLDRSGDPGLARNIEPAVDQSLVQTSFGTTGRYARVVAGRMGQVLSARTMADAPEKSGLWARGYGGSLHQDATGTSDGYEADLRGVSFGYDRSLSDRILVGVSGGYAKNTVTTKDTNTGADVESRQAGLYGSMAKEAYYLGAVLSVAWNRYDASRHIAFGTIDRTARGDYAGEQYSGFLEGGYIFQGHGAVFTPAVSLQAMRLHLEDFTETNADSLNLKVDSQDYTLFQTGLGAKIAFPMEYNEMRFVPELHASFLYDFIGDAQQATAAFTGDDASFVTKGSAPPKSSGNIGAKLAIVTHSSWTFSFGCDYEMKKDFYALNGHLDIRYAF